MMHDNGVSGGVLTAVSRGNTPANVPSFAIDDAAVHRMCGDIAGAIADYPGMFVGAIMLDVRLGYAAAKHVRIAVEEYGLSAVRIMTSHSMISIDDALCFPLYTVACELGIPVTINVGIPGPTKPARYQYPMPIDDVALTFPDLTIVMTHMGNPWITEVVALMEKHRRVYLMTSGWAPKYVPEEIRTFMSTRGAGKVMWASDYPVLSIERTVNEGKALDVRADSLPRYMGANALEVFGAPTGWNP